LDPCWATGAHERVDGVPRPLPSVFNACKTVHLGDTLSKATALLGGAWERYSHSPRWGQIFSMTSGWSIQAMIRIDPSHRGQIKGSASWTVWISWAQRCLRAGETEGGGSLWSLRELPLERVPFCVFHGSRYGHHKRNKDTVKPLLGSPSCPESEVRLIISPLPCVGERVRVSNCLTCQEV
jgi:hypothetical protein